MAERLTNVTVGDGRPESGLESMTMRRSLQQGTG